MKLVDKYSWLVECGKQFKGAECEWKEEWGVERFLVADKM